MIVRSGALRLDQVVSPPPPPGFDGSRPTDWDEIWSKQLEAEVLASITVSTNTVGTYEIDLAGSGDVALDWGDGSIDYETLGVSDTYSHDYVAGGTLTITGVSNVTEIDTNGDSDVTAVSIPAEAVNIETIRLLGTSATSFTTHAEWVNLDQLNINASSITSLETHAEWINLTLLVVSYSDVTSLETHAEWVNLTNLYAQATSINSIETHSEWTSLETIYVYSTLISSFTTHQEWTALSGLRVNSTSITNVLAYAQWTSITDFRADDNAIISATNINNILIALDTAGMSSGTIELSGGTNAAPTGAGITAKNNLIGRGVTVNTN